MDGRQMTRNNGKNSNIDQNTNGQEDEEIHDILRLEEERYLKTEVGFHLDKW